MEYINAGFDVITSRKFEKEELIIRQRLTENASELYSILMTGNTYLARILNKTGISENYNLQRNSKNVLVTVSKQGLQNIIFENFAREEEEDWLGQKKQ